MGSQGVILLRFDDELTHEIVQKARDFGASLAGVAPVAALRGAPSHLCEPLVDWESRGRSIIVMGLLHDRETPRLDWWDGNQGTAGNRRLIEAGRGLAAWLLDAHGLRAWDLHYYLGKGGVFLKDAAVVAGLGVIGRNNLLLTPEHGPLVRLRAIACESELAASPMIENDPCDGCAMPCRRACPQGAFETGAYAREQCRKQMTLDEDRAAVESGGPNRIIKYCRACEIHCPAGG